MKLLKQSLVLCLSFLSVFVWQHTFLANYTLFLFGILFVVYSITAYRKKEFDIISNIQNDLVGLYILNTILILLVMMSGNYQSPIFFLLYFLSFGIAFGYQPGIIFVFIAGILLLFLPDTFKDDETRNILMLSSLIIISLATFFFNQTLLKKK